MDAWSSYQAVGIPDYEQVVFSHPPIGTIGLTEPQAKTEFGEANVRVLEARFASMLRLCFAISTDREPRGHPVECAGIFRDLQDL